MTKKIALLLAFAVLTTAFFSCNTKEKTMENPVLSQFNEPIPFDKLTAANIKQAADTIIVMTKEDLKSIYAVADNERTFDNTMLKMDGIYARFSKVSGIIYLMAFTHPDSAVRAEALKGVEMLDKFGNEMSLDEQAYKAVKAYSLTEEAKALTSYKKRYTEKTVRGYERSGFALPADKREQLKALKDSVSQIGLTFDNNITEFRDSLVLTETEMEGLPDDFKESHKRADGKFVVDLTYPSFRPFMKYSKSDNARKQLFIKFNNRAADKNIAVLKQLLSYRKQMSNLLGYKSYAAYIVEDRMAKTPENVWKFESELAKNLKVKAEKDYQEILDVKRSVTKNPKASVIEPWESGFYTTILMKDKYQVDDEKTKEYFEVSNVINGLLDISQALYDVKFEEVKTPIVWHADVRQFEVKRDDKIVGRFYLDLFPRDNKYGHAASFPIIAGRMTADGYEIPVNALVCNFPKPTKDKPSLMPHSDVETFFHEFGHLLHSLLTTAELSGQSGTSVANDFVEVPSQLYENYSWNYETLKMFAKHYKTGEVLPKDMFDKMLAAKNVGSGIGTQYQVFYGSLDMTLHDNYDPTGKETTTDVVRRLQNEMTLFKYMEGTSFEASFGHLNGYGAGYYGYLWALVYAEDMFSVFEKNGILDKATGIRYRDQILAKGSTEDEYELVKNFLGREPNQEAFLKSIGL